MSRLATGESLSPPPSPLPGALSTPGLPGARLCPEATSHCGNTPGTLTTSETPGVLGNVYQELDKSPMIDLNDITGHPLAFGWVP